MSSRPRSFSPPGCVARIRAQPVDGTASTGFGGTRLERKGDLAAVHRIPGGIIFSTTSMGGHYLYLWSLSSPGKPTIGRLLLPRLVRCTGEWITTNTVAGSVCGQRSSLMGGKFCLNTSLHNVSIGCVLYECQQGICIDCRGQINSVVLQTRAASNISSSNPNLPSGSL